jgi:enolase
LRSTSVCLHSILNGGKHAGGNLKLQEFMIVPAGGKPFAETIRHAAEVYHHLGKILVAKYGPSAKNLGDEGGYAPPLDDPDEALALLEQAVEAAGLVVGVDMFFAIDAAASEFYEEAKGDKPYEVRPDQWISSDELVAFYVQMKKDHPGLISIEDGMDEKDYTGWINLTAAFDEQFPDTIIVGDDLFTTNTNLISKGLEAKWANALLLKVNQIGTISESMAAARLLFAQKGMVAVSHRSGETVSSVISDLAVGIGAQFIKTGATARGERVCKYNRLLAIEEHLRENGKI